MKQYELNVFRQNYLPWKYPRNWWDNVRQFFRNCKHGWQRATKGYCDADTWDLSNYYVALLHDSLVRFQQISQCIPNGFSEDEWTDYLNRIIQLLELYDEDIDGKNPYTHQFYKILESHRKMELDDQHRLISTISDLTPEEKEIERLFYQTQIELAHERDDYQKEAFQMISEKLNELWW